MVMDYSLYIRLYQSAVGELALLGDGRCLSGLCFTDEHDPGMEPMLCRARPAAEDAFADVVRWLDLYFAGREPGFVPRLALDVTPWRRSLYQALMGVGFGHTVSYGALAGLAGSAVGAARAVGTAMRLNPVVLIVPCHRVTAGGSLGRYAGGVWRKRWLIEWEARHL